MTKVCPHLYPITVPIRHDLKYLETRRKKNCDWVTVQAVLRFFRFYLRLYFMGLGGWVKKNGGTVLRMCTVAQITMR